MGSTICLSSARALFVACIFVCLLQGSKEALKRNSQNQLALVILEPAQLLPLKDFSSLFFLGGAGLTSLFGPGLGELPFGAIAKKATRREPGETPARESEV